MVPSRSGEKSLLFSRDAGVVLEAMILRIDEVCCVICWRRVVEALCCVSVRLLSEKRDEDGFPISCCAILNEDYSDFYVVAPDNPLRIDCMGFF